MMLSGVIEAIGLNVVRKKKAKPLTQAKVDEILALCKKAEGGPVRSTEHYTGIIRRIKEILSE